MMTAHDLELEQGLTDDELREIWPVLSDEERFDGFRLLPRTDAEQFFETLSSSDQFDILTALPESGRRSWMRLLPPDDAADLVQEAPDEERESFLALLDAPTRKEVVALMAYAEDDAGGLMNPRYARLRPEMNVDEAINYLRRQTTGREETLYYIYVLDPQQRLLGVISMRDLFKAAPSKRVQDVMQTDLITAHEEMDQEDMSLLFAEHDLLAIPVVDTDSHMKGIVTVDDIVDVVQEEATEDMQKYGGMAALDEPYLDLSVGRMIGKRVGWLIVLFFGLLLTTSAMQHFEDHIARAVVLAFFIPLIIATGGNTGSQASTLVVRAMALGEIRLRDWWRVFRRELVTGLGLGLVMGILGFIRVAGWEWAFGAYGEHYLLIAWTMSITLVGVVLWGALAGAMLPFVLKRLGFDPASASAPFVGTLVDVSGILIYFAVATIILKGSLL
jgi:magnesium transporter